MFELERNRELPESGGSQRLPERGLVLVACGGRRGGGADRAQKGEDEMMLGTGLSQGPPPPGPPPPGPPPPGPPPHHGHHGGMYRQFWSQPSPTILVVPAEQSVAPGGIIPGLSNVHLAVGLLALAAVYLLARRQS